MFLFVIHVTTMLSSRINFFLYQFFLELFCAFRLVREKFSSSVKSVFRQYVKIRSDYTSFDMIVVVRMHVPGQCLNFIKLSPRFSGKIVSFLFWDVPFLHFWLSF